MLHGGDRVGGGDQLAVALADDRAQGVAAALGLAARLRDQRCDGADAARPQHLIGIAVHRHAQKRGNSGDVGSDVAITWVRASGQRVIVD